MGLDFVEIIMEVEDVFGVKIEDDDLFEKPTKERPKPVERTTVGDLYDLILEKRRALDLPMGKVKPEAFAMRDVRLALADVLHMAPDEFRVKDRLSRLLPREDRRKIWRRLRRILRGKLPALKPDGPWYGVAWWSVFVVATLGVGGLVYWFILADQPKGFSWHPVIAIVSALSAFLGMMLTFIVMALPIWPFKGIPKEVRTVELLAKSHLARNRRYYIDECGGSDSDEDVWHTLRIILVDILGVEFDEIAKEADLIRDLGAG